MKKHKYTDLNGNIFFTFTNNYLKPDNMFFLSFSTPEYQLRNELDRLEQLDEEVDKMDSYPEAEALLSSILK